MSQKADFRSPSAAKSKISRAAALFILKMPILLWQAPRAAPARGGVSRPAMGAHFDKMRPPRPRGEVSLFPRGEVSLFPRGPLYNRLYIQQRYAIIEKTLKKAQRGHSCHRELPSAN